MQRERERVRNISISYLGCYYVCVCVKCVTLRQVIFNRYGVFLSVIIIYLDNGRL